MSLLAEGVAIRRGQRTIVEGVDLELVPGRTVGLVGPSGVGKSSLARVLCGLLEPAAGKVLLDGSPRQVRRGRMDGAVQMLFQSPRRSCSPRLRLWQTLGEPLGRCAADDPRVAELARRVGLSDDLLLRLPGEVSDGQVQRAALGRALAGSPRFLLCDEATTMLDAVTTAGVVGLLRREAEAGLGVLAISHDAELLEAWAEEVWELTPSGLICAGR